MKFKQQNGFTLIELMVAITIGLFLSIIVAALLISSIQGSNRTMRIAKINEELDSAMILVESSLVQSGFKGGPVNISELRENEFNQIYVQGQDPLVSDKLPNVDTNGTCIIYAFDQNNNALLETNEISGFRRNGNNIEKLHLVSTTTISGLELENSHKVAPDPDAFDFDANADLLCDVGDAAVDAVWERLNTEDTVITAFDVGVSSEQLMYPNTTTLTDIYRRTATVTVAGENSADSEINATKTTIVRMKNDLYAP